MGKCHEKGRLLLMLFFRLGVSFSKYYYYSLNREQFQIPQYFPALADLPMLAEVSNTCIPRPATHAKLWVKTFSFRLPTTHFTFTNGKQ